MVGGPGNDLLNGGPGHDTFVFASTLNEISNLDTISDFSTADDRLLLSDTVFSGAGVPGTLSADTFFIGVAAHDADDRIIYNDLTGALSYDLDGSGAGATIQFAILSPGLALANAHFTIF